MKCVQINSVIESRKSFPYYSDRDHPNYIKNEEDYTRIMKIFFDELVYKLITTGKKVKLPMKLGAFQVIKYKRQELLRDRVSIQVAKRKGKVLDKKQYFMNYETEGYWTRLHWYKTPSMDALTGKCIGCTVKNCNSYQFTLTRPNLRPNSYNPRNPRVSLYRFFKDKGWLIYKEKRKLYEDVNTIN